MDFSFVFLCKLASAGGVDSGPEAKNLSILTIFLRKPHLAADYWSREVASFWPAATYCSVSTKERSEGELRSID